MPNINLDLTYRLTVNRRLKNQEVDDNFRKLVAAVNTVNDAVGAGQDPTQAIATAIQAHVANPNAHPQYLLDAPSDTKAYQRKNGQWVEGAGMSRVNQTAVSPMAFIPDYYQLQANCAFCLEHIIFAPPGTPSQAVVANLVLNTLGGIPGENTGGNNGDGHLIGIFNLAQVYSNIKLFFGHELRLECKSGKTLDQYVANKHVVGPDNQNGGVIKEYCLEQLDNMTEAVAKVQKFTQNYFDPRLVTTHLGGQICGTAHINASVTLTKKDSGKFFMCTNTSDITVMLGTDVTDGCQFHFVQAAAGKITFDVTPDKALYSKANQRQTNGVFCEATLRVYPYGGTFATFINA